MKKFSGIVFILLFFASSNNFGQAKVERQHRIKKSQFPSEAINSITENSTAVKRLKFYREVDTAQTVYTAKFKKSRLFYEMDFDKNGKFKSMGFNVKQVDIPQESFERITNYLSKNFEKSKIRKMLQSYPTEGKDGIEKTIKNAFQNLMVTNMFYKLLVRGKKGGKSLDYKVVFDAEGNLIEIRKSLPANHDLVLY